MLIDNHCHFEQLTPDEQQRAMQHFNVVGVGSDLASCQQLLTLNAQYNNLWLCLGIHPEQQHNYTDFELVSALIRAHRQQIVGIGEIGLPYFSLQKLAAAERAALFQQGYRLFDKFIMLAQELLLPVNLHCVGESTFLAIDCLKHYAIDRALFHWFAGSQAAIRQIHANGWFISISPDVLHNHQYQQTVQLIPKEMLCLESDGPWLYAGKRGQPDMMLATAQYLATVHQCDIKQIIDINQKNSQKLWGSSGV